MHNSQTSNRSVIGVMGEFSVGKSTLCNLLLGTNDLPEMVTATQLPPIWFTKGADQDTLVMKDGRTRAVEDITDLKGALVEAGHLLLHRDYPILDIVDIVDFPGISDPNMDASVWQNLLPRMDAILWLTHATQAWRQSEAAAWNTVSRAVQARSALVVTQIDKVIARTDRDRILKRLDFEAGDLFKEILPVSLKEALVAEGDIEALEASGAVELYKYLLEFEGVAGAASQGPLDAPTLHEDTVAQDARTPFRAAAPDTRFDQEPREKMAELETHAARRSAGDSVTPREDVPRQERVGGEVLNFEGDFDTQDPEDTPGRIMPRRVKPRGKSRRARLEKTSDQYSSYDSIEAFAARM